MTSTIAERRASATAELAELEQARGAAALDGTAFDIARLRECHAELEALDAAELVATRREAEAEAAALAVAKRQAAEDARVALASYTGAVERSEQSSKALASELRVLDEAAAELRRCYLAMGRVLPVPLEAKAVRVTVSRLIAGELTGIERVCGFGDLKWPSVPVAADWLEHVTKWIQPAVEAAIEKEIG